MIDTDDETSPYQSGYLTPPPSLSPTKTVSTEGWFSPRTPASPRKTRSCLFFRDIEFGTGGPFLTPPSSPTKTKVAPLLDTLSIPGLIPANGDLALSQPQDDSPVKRKRVQAIDQFPSCRSTLRNRLCARSSPEPVISPGDVTCCSPTAIGSSNHNQLDSLSSLPNKRRRQSRSSSDSSLGRPGNIAHYATAISRPGSADGKSSLQPFLNCIDRTFEDCSNSAKLHQIPLRYASSPLRPSQWAARGGLLSPPRPCRTGTPDRYIALRRPPTGARESFELNKPAERLARDQVNHRGSRTGTDVFSRRLRRSDRMNDELRSLREAHSLITGRTIANRRHHAFGRNAVPLGLRQISAGAVWNVGGASAVSDTVAGVSTGRGGMLASGTNAPLYRSAFLNRADPEAELEAYEKRLALALDVDQTQHVQQHAPTRPDLQIVQHGDAMPLAKHVWRDGAWIKDGIVSRLFFPSSDVPYPVHTDWEIKHVIGHGRTREDLCQSYPSVLDAPNLRDDYYCTLLAYSHTFRCLAVGLGDIVHLWSERSGVDTPESLNAAPSESRPSGIQHVTSLDFSSIQGGQAILAVGRADGRISLWSPFDAEPRFDAAQPKPISCVCWRPNTVPRPSLRDRAMAVPTEELLIGDEVGHIYFYSVEWPSETQSTLFGWHGAMTLIARLTIHSQQICGLAWSLDGELFASGGNDNNCNLFETNKVLRRNNTNERTSATLDVRRGPRGESIYTVANRNNPVLHLPQSVAKHTWTLNAAVKAMAFCPWQRGLIAVGGGSNDRCIHFYHTRSGTCLATIDCAAQITSLIWSQTRREIAATFGFAQPEHPYRIAVFAWPSCEQVVAVPWVDENRALCAVAYAGGPTSGLHTDDGWEDGRARGEDGVWSRRGVEEGCIVIAASDMAIRFHEIWSDQRGSVAPGGSLGPGSAGSLGGSDILEGSHGLGRDSGVIR